MLPSELSPRLRQVAAAIAGGRSYKSIARQYGVNISTVVRHVDRLFVRYGVYSKDQLAAELNKMSVRVLKSDLVRWREQAIASGASDLESEIGKLLEGEGRPQETSYVFLAH